MKLLSSHVFRDHVLIGGIAAFLVSPIFGFWGAGSFWAATVLIDIDHYMKFVYYTGFKVFGVTPMLQYHDKVFEYKHHPELLSLEIFHTAEFLVFLGAIAIWFAPSLLPVFWGCVFHIVVDFVHLGRFKILEKRTHSFFEYFWRRRKMLAQGKNPDYVFKTALRLLDLPSIL